MELQPLLKKPVMLLTNDGRIFVGFLHGFDASTNVTLTTAHERVYSMGAGVQVKQVGCQIIRGDMLAVIGLIDETVEETLDYESVRANPMPPITH